MLWLLIPAGLFLFRNKIAAVLGKYLPQADPVRINFYGHLITLAAAACYILPLEFVGMGTIKRSSFIVCMWSSILGGMFTIQANNGVPPMPQNVGLSNIKQSFQTMSVNIQPWLQKVTQGGEFPYLFFALIFITAYPSIVPLLILGRRSLWNVCTYASKNTPDNALWKRFRPIWEEKLKPKNDAILLYSALAEIILGIYLVVSVALPARQLIVTLLYWNFLTTRYKLPKSQPLHKQAWGQLGAKVEPVFKFLPILRKPIQYAKTYFA